MIVRLLPALVVMAAIFLLSHLPGDSLDLNSPEGTDKICHAIAYGFLALSCIHAVRSESERHRTPWLKGLAIVLFCFLYGISDEFHQTFIAGRTADRHDLAADTMGAFFVILCWWHLCFHGIRRKKRRKNILKGALKN